MNAILLQCCGAAANFIKCSCDANEATNVHDLGLAGTICHAFICVTGIIVGGFLFWKLIEYIANGIAERRKRAWEVEDIKRKQDKDLQDKLLSFLEKNTIKEEYKKDDDKKEGKVVKTMKELTSKESAYYITVLKKFINKGIPDLEIKS